MTETTEPASLARRARRLAGRVRWAFRIDVYDVFVRPVEPEHAELEVPAGYDFRWGTADEVLACDELHTELDERERREGAERLGFGHRVVIAFHEGTAVFSMWVNPRNLNVPGEVKRRLGPHQAFIYKAYTSPHHRGQGLYKVGMRFVLRELLREGKTELVGYAHVKKDVSRRGLATLEFRSAGRYTSVRAPGFQRTILSAELKRSFPEPVARSSRPSSSPP